MYTPLGSIWVFPKIGVPQNRWFIMESPIKMDDLGGTIISGNTHIYITPDMFFSMPPCSAETPGSF